MMKLQQKISARREAPHNRAEVKGLCHRAWRSRPVKLGAARPGRRWEGWEQPRQRRDGAGTARRPGSGKQDEKVYLAMRRALGLKLTTFGQRLLSFVGYLEQHGASHLTTDAALAWATSTPGSTDQVHWSRRLMVVRSFARHLKALDAATEVPPADILPHHYRRSTPHLYPPSEIAALLAAAGALRPPLRALTWRTLIGLLAVTGLRVGEACRLDHADPKSTYWYLTGSPELLALAAARLEQAFGGHQ